MPNHIHLLLGLQAENVRPFQHKLLRFTAQKIIKEMKESENPLLASIKSTQSDRILHFWERIPKWKAILTTDIFYQKLRYIHNNPLQEKWQLSVTPEAYKMSSAMSYVKNEPEFEFLTLFE
jgi:putative transposase